MTARRDGTVLSVRYSTRSQMIGIAEAGHPTHTGEDNASRSVGPEQVAMVAAMTPTIGRRIWLWPNGCLPGSRTLDPTQAFDAGVIFVHDDGKVNLEIVDHIGHRFVEEGVELVPDGYSAPSDKIFATWMPYQVGQAKKEAASS